MLLNQAGIYRGEYTVNLEYKTEDQFNRKIPATENNPSYREHGSVKWVDGQEIPTVDNVDMLYG